MFDSDVVLSAVAAGASAALSAALISILKPLLVRHLMAHPNERSSHVEATPGGAGFGVMTATILAHDDFSQFAWTVAILILQRCYMATNLV